MIKSKFAKIIDAVFIVSGTFALSFYIFGFYVSSLPLLIIISICISVSVIAVCRFIFGIKSNKKKEKKEISLFFEKLLFMGKSKIFEELNKALNSKHPTRIENGLIIAGTSAFANCFTDKLTLPLLAEIYANTINSKCNKLIVLCVNADKQAINYAKQLENLKIIILEDEESYLFLKWIGFENPTIKIAETKKGFFESFSKILSPDKAPRYFSLFVFFLGFSFILRNSVYYIVFAAILLVMSILAKSNIIKKLRK